MAGDREFDVVVFGATGFVGRLVVRYLADRVPQVARIGLAGRSMARLEALRARVGPGASAWPLLVADATEPSSLDALARAARVVVTAVGPYRPHGLALVEACATRGTDYVDLSGEVLFVRDSIDHCHELAVGTGARIVHCCGVDSVPSDLGVLSLHQAAVAESAGDLEDTTLVVRAFRGGYSGGTLATMKLQLDETRRNPQSRRTVEDPYGLSPDRAAEPDLGEEPDLTRVEHDEGLGMWVGPFVMAPINTRVVRRSNALQNWAYGRRFRYREVTGYGAGAAGRVKAVAAGASLQALRAGLGFGPSRALLDRVLPAPGRGPSARRRAAGLLRMDIHAPSSTGVHYVSRIAASGDPGYTVSSRMIGESALCLALERSRLPERAGVLTPATAIGTILVERLGAAGVSIVTERIEP